MAPLKPLKIAAGALLLSGAFAQAQAATCGPREQFVEQLRNTFHESARGVGLASPTQVIEFWSSEENGTFSILMTYPDGTSCVMATGQNWVAQGPEKASLGRAL